MFDFLRKKMKVSSKMEVTKRIIDKIKKSGDDTSIPRDVSFLFIGERDHLNKLLVVLNSNGFKSGESNYSEPEKSLLVTKIMDIDSLIKTDILSQMQKLADRYSVIFDGWETESNKKCVRLE